MGKLTVESESDTAPFGPEEDEPGAGATQLASAADADLGRAITQCLTALGKTLEVDPTAYGLIHTMTRTGYQLVDTLTELSDSSCPLRTPSPESDDRRAEFVQIFTDRVVGVSATPADSAARVAAVRCARKLLEDNELADSLNHGGRYHLSDSLFCAIYELFLKNVLTEFIAGIAAAKLSVALPFLHFIDPVGKISDSIADAVAGRLLDPCAERYGSSDVSLADLSRELLGENVRRLLGLPTEP